MNEKWQLVWDDSRKANGGYVPFLVEATETPAGWEFNATEEWESRGLIDPPGLRLVQTAEYFKRAFLRNRLVAKSTAYAVLTEGKTFASIRIVRSVNPALRDKGVLGNQTILAKMRFRCARRLPVRLAGRRPVGAIAA